MNYEYRHLGKPLPVHRTTEPATAPIGQEAPENAAHTPTPWKVFACDLVTGGDDDGVVCRIPNHPDNGSNWRANAAFIVKAVNSHHMLWDRIRKVEHDNNQAAARIAKLEADLYECREYLEGRVDVVDGDYGEPAPNRAMQLVSMIDETLGEGR